ncbi:MAG TPA: aspartate-semialdehyde dehydrogenase [Gemmatimonadaceae bacterium]|nr:aspartate-semialdehyde dehydrogenase [Gemmatimonadaceae bacterium]
MSAAAEPRIPVAILGATGAVGQTFVRLLDGHPWFRVAEVAASERSAGKSYAEATRWIDGAMPADVARLSVLPCDPTQLAARVVFSALDSSAAGELEPAFARAGRFVLSNAKNFRMDPDVPLVIPEVNASHLGLIAAQRKARGWKGAIVTNANCAATVATVAMAPLHERFGIRTVFAATMQAVSGAGYPGVPSLDILGNVIPFINDEEPKIEREMQKMLGRLVGSSIEPANFVVSAHANRVPVEHGHTVCLSLGFDHKGSVEEAIDVLRKWRGSSAVRGLPSAPELPLRYRDEPDRPQPRRDVGEGRGMTVSVGRVREDPILHLRLVAMGHNTVRGAAGGSILNAELLVQTGAIPGKKKRESRE